MIVRAHLLVGVLAAATVVCPPPAHAQLTTSSSAAAGELLPVTVDEMVRAALDLNLTLRLQRLTRDLAAADLLSARATFDPAWTLQLDRQQNTTDVVGDRRYGTGTNALTASVGGTLPTSTSYALGVSASKASADPLQAAVGPFADNYSTGVSLQLRQPLLRGFGVAAANAPVRAARSASLAASEDERRDIARTIEAVEAAFWRLRLAESVAEIARASLARAQELRDRNVAMRARDLVTRLDVITAQRTVALRETAHLDAARQRVDAAEQLAFLAYGSRIPDAIRRGSVVLRTSGAYPAPPASRLLAEIEDDALATRHDAIAARDRLRSATTLTVLARDALRPGLDLTLQVDHGGTSDLLRPFSYANPSSARRSVVSVGAALSIPQLNWRARAEFQRSTLQTEAARLNIALIENAVRAEVRAALRGVQLSEQSLASSREVVALAEEEFRIARAGLDLRQITTFQLFQYEGDLVAARLTLAQDEYALAAAISAFDLATGRIGERYGVPRVSQPDPAPPARR